MLKNSTWSALLLAATTASLVAAAGEARSELTVHEWGTFTSVAGADGRAVAWKALSGPSDLPCFVSVLNPKSIKVALNGDFPAVSAMVRMETPVLYFYAPRKTAVRATVDFPEGLMTEWYPQGAPSPGPRGIQWTDVQIDPAARPEFRSDGVKSHYYAARETDASPLSVGGEREKFLFYRGIANFNVPVSTTVAHDGTVAVEPSGAHQIRTLILFESDGTRIGYRVMRNAASTSTLERPALTATLESPRRDMQSVLVEEGLYPREALAMVNTWRDSWFERGLRLFYLLPQAAVDSILPLRIEPRPAQTVRVFVGRVEIISPAMVVEVDRAIRANDMTVLTQYGRFLEPIAQRIFATSSVAVQQPQVNAALQSVARRYVSPQAACGVSAPVVATTAER